MIISTRLVVSVGSLLLVTLNANSVAAEEAWRGYETKPLAFEGKGLGDADNDGVIDARDDCENINADVVISNAGCAEDKDVIAQTVLDIEFKSNGWHVNKKYFSELKHFATFYQQHPGAYVSIEGHTDSTGKAEHNMKLSQFRAQAVVKLLTDQYGFDKHKVSWVGYGETKPVADNKSKAGRKKNRRIVAVVSARELHKVLNWSVY